MYQYDWLTVLTVLALADYTILYKMIANPASFQNDSDDFSSRDILIGMQHLQGEMLPNTL